MQQPVVRLCASGRRSDFEREFDNDLDIDDPDIDMEPDI